MGADFSMATEVAGSVEPALHTRQSLQVETAQTIAKPSATEAVARVAGTGPKRSAAIPVQMLEMLMVSVRKP
jgi:hypothetical protein